MQTEQVDMVVSEHAARLAASRAAIIAFRNAMNKTTANNDLVKLAIASRPFCHTDKMTHDEEMKQGVATDMVHTLHNLLTEKVVDGVTYYHDSLSDVQGISVAVIASALSVMFRCSRPILEKHIATFESDLIESLCQMILIFSSWTGETTVAQVVYSSTTKIIRSIVSLVPDACEDLIDILTVILKADTSADICVDAACAMAGFFDDLHAVPTQRALSRIEDNGSSLISTLSSASQDYSHDSEDLDPMNDLYKLAAISSVIRCKMVKRRGALLAVAKHMQIGEVFEIRERAMNFCADIFGDAQCMVVLSKRSDDSVELLLQGLVDSANNEIRPTLRLAAVALIGAFVAVPNFDSEKAMGALQDLAYTSEPDEVVIEAAYCYCQGSYYIGELSTEVVSTIVEFSTFPLAKVRAEALQRLDALIAEDPAVTETMLADTDVLESYSLMVLYGSDQDCTVAMNICRQLAAEPRFHTTLCNHDLLVHAVVGYVTQDKVVENRAAHWSGIEIILSLLKDENNVKAFIGLPQLLPWLVTFLNSTTAKESFKKKVVTAILRLSSTLLEETSVAPSLRSASFSSQSSNASAASSVVSSVAAPSISRSPSLSGIKASQSTANSFAPSSWFCAFATSI